MNNHLYSSQPSGKLSSINRQFSDNLPEADLTQPDNGAIMLFLSVCFTEPFYTENRLALLRTSKKRADIIT